MEFIFLLIILVVFGIIVDLISSAVDRKQAQLRDQATKDVLGSSNIEPVIKEYKEKLDYIEYRKQEIADRVKESNVKILEINIVPSEEKCPKCKKGALIIRDGKYGKFLGCTNYPRCNYIKAQKGLLTNEQIINSMRKIYS